MEHTITIELEDVLQYEADQAGLTKDQWIAQYVNGHLGVIQPNYLANEAAKNKAEYDAKIAAYDTAKPTIDGIAALPEPEKKLIQDIIDQKITAEAVATAGVVVEEVKP